MHMVLHLYILQKMHYAASTERKFQDQMLIEGVFLKKCFLEYRGK